ncbi:unnamed protein product [Trifolium pratense]|uniref:Uncharacterized protein n=1 Tax=Trifolium pratense TaxID=57577 RepID=A0ACB0K8E8_TRIPR|nr:unnamed protein product [Trifolium pratense]
MGRGQGHTARTIEDTGCAVGCMTLDRSNSDIIIAREDAIYYYAVDGRGPCYAYDGPKNLVATFKDYVALASPPTASSKAKIPIVIIGSLEGLKLMIFLTHQLLRY